MISFSSLYFAFIAFSTLLLTTAATNPDCDGGSDASVRRNNKCIFIRRVSQLRNDAKLMCENSNARLAEPRSNETMQNEFGGLLSLVGAMQAHVGVSQATANGGGVADNWKLDSGTLIQVSEKVFGFSSHQIFNSFSQDNSSLSADIKWVPGQPNDAISTSNVEDGEEQCGAISNSGGLIGMWDSACGSHVRAATLCEYDVDAISSEEKIVNDPARAECLKLKGQFLGGSCFFVTTGAHTWTDCWTQLAASKARLARIYTNEILMKLQTLLGTAGTKYWTSLKNMMWHNDAAAADVANGGNIRPYVTGQDAVSLCGVIDAKVNPFIDSKGCASSYNCLGEIVTPFQKYTKRFENSQVNGTGPSQMKTKLIELMDERPCAFECQQTEGCLSFTYQPSNGNCTLYAAKSDAISSHFTMVNEPGVHFYERNY